MQAGVRASTALLLVWTHLAAVSAHPRRWEVMSLGNGSHHPVSGQITKPLKIRLVNHEQRQLTSQLKSGNKTGFYLEALRPAALGARTLVTSGNESIPVFSVVKAAGVTSTASAGSSQAPKNRAAPKVPEAIKIPFNDKLESFARSTPTPLSELEIKEDGQLMKALQRTTMRTRTYPEEKTTPVPTTTTSTSSAVNETSTLPSKIPEQVTPSLPPTSTTQVAVSLPATVTPFPLAPFPGAPGAGLLYPGVASTTTPIPYEQLGCGFDFLTNTCKDIWGLGWCLGCSDFGNVFLHDCRCTQPAPPVNLTLPVPGHIPVPVPAPASVVVVPGGNQTSSTEASPSPQPPPVVGGLQPSFLLHHARFL